MKKNIINKVKMLSSVIFLVILVCICGNISSVQAKRLEKNTLITIPVGNGKKEVTYNTYSAGKEGSKDFWISEDAVYLLDSENMRVMVYISGEWKNNINLEDIGYPSRICVIENDLYILDLLNNLIVKYNMQGKKTMSYKIHVSGGARGITQLMEENGKLAFICDGKVLGLKDDVTHKEIRKISSIPTEKLVIGKRKNTNVTISYQSIDNSYTQIDKIILDSDMIFMETVIKQTGKKDSSDQFYLLKSKDWECIPDNFIRVFNGKLYVLHCFKNEVRIEKAMFSDSYRSSLPQLAEQSRKRKEKFLNIQKAENKTSLSRVEVIDRAEELRALTWTLEKGHKVVLKNTILSSVVSNAKNGSTFTGVPYCWGGYYGLTDRSSLGTYSGLFTRDIKKIFSDGSRYMAGNVKNAGLGYIGKTIGIDCSGFISSVYDLNKKEYTGSLKSDYYSIQFSELQPGDMIVSTKEGHVMLFGGKKSETEYVVYDSNSSIATGKVMRRSISISHLNNYDYVARTPWN